MYCRNPQVLFGSHCPGTTLPSVQSCYPYERASKHHRLASTTRKSTAGDQSTLHVRVQSLQSRTELTREILKQLDLLARSVSHMTEDDKEKSFRNQDQQLPSCQHVDRKVILVTRESLQEIREDVRTLTAVHEAIDS
jgi:mevalonate kinase